MFAASSIVTVAGPGRRGKWITARYFISLCPSPFKSNRRQRKQNPKQRQVERSGMMETQNELDLRKFVIPEFVFGVDARHLAGRYARNFGARKVFVVSDPGVIQAGWTDQVTRSLDAQDL